MGSSHRALCEVRCAKCAVHGARREVPQPPRISLHLLLSPTRSSLSQPP
jgi:hypothetical protein